ncbi:hypothetical protein LOK49_LG13G01000 [Camellia lanceoleosa]|uniref:Uncharacterized protein n=1 Tax=Camellia lanceoleosa TaxID=1840588 RepID=A0ACC0FKP6_9ERIC|nr:hypothetical protein LOK49_LG13G01000 [Camellia lanceoleosa]
MTKLQWSHQPVGSVGSAKERDIDVANPMGWLLRCLPRSLSLLKGSLRTPPPPPLLIPAPPVLIDFVRAPPPPPVDVDLGHIPKVKKILNEDPLLEKKENPTPEEVEENKKWWEEFESSPVIQFVRRSEEIADKINELELKENESPYRSEDAKLWKASFVILVISTSLQLESTLRSNISPQPQQRLVRN